MVDRSPQLAEVVVLDIGQAGAFDLVQVAIRLRTGTDGPSRFAVHFAGAVGFLGSFDVQNNSAVTARLADGQRPNDGVRVESTHLLPNRRNMPMCNVITSRCLVFRILSGM